MAKLEKKTKAELIMMCNERGSEIERLRKEVATKQEMFVRKSEEVQDLIKQKKHLEADMEGSEKAFNDAKVEMTTEIQSLREKITDRDKTISMQGESYQSLKKDFDNLIHENGLNKAQVIRYKLATVVAFIAFIIALIWAC